MNKEQREKLASEVATKLYGDATATLENGAFKAALEALNRAVPDGCVVVSEEALRWAVQHLCLEVYGESVGVILETIARELSDMLEAGGEND